MIRVATDVGGTFTDLVYLDDRGLHVAKAHTTPPDFERGLLAAIDGSGLDGKEVEFFAHGTTVVINALLSRRGAKTALATTAGFRDVLEIARGNRPDLFNFAFAKPRPFVPRARRFEVDERIDYQGKVKRPLGEDAFEALAEQIARANVEAVAICFLHAYLNPAHEIRVESFLRQRFPELSVVSSYSVCREWREYERTSTAVLSAYVHPLATSYLGALSTELRVREVESELLVMQSNGGVATVRGALNNPISMVESGPASGMLGAAQLGRQIGEPNFLALDIGGTTAKTALIADGKVRISSDYRIEWDRTNPAIRSAFRSWIWSRSAMAGDRSPGSTREAACTSVRSARARNRVRRPMDRAARNPRRPTPTCCWAGSTRTCSWAESDGRTWKPSRERSPVSDGAWAAA